MGTGRRRQDRGTTGKGVWPLEAGGGGGSRLSLVIRDVQEVYQSQAGTVRHSKYSLPHSAPTAGGRKTRAPQYVDGFSMIISILGGHPAGVGRFGPCLQGAGTDERDRNGVELGGVGVGEVGTRDTYPDSPPPA